MGLVVDEILDIVEEALEVELKSSAPGLMGSAIVAGRATDLVDATHYLTRAFGDWFDRARETEAAGRGKKVLLVDDSAFFLNLLSPLLATAGYEVTTAEDAGQAMTMYEEGRRFDVIISDVEMPGMSGFEFAEAVRNSERWRDTPMVALSSRTSEQDLDRGRRVGFSGYVPKFDRDALLRALSQTIAESGGAA